MRLWSLAERRNQADLVGRDSGRDMVGEHDLQHDLTRMGILAEGTSGACEPDVPLATICVDQS